jgi:hypothetical protein
VEGTDDLMVIDPSIFDRPVTVKAFIAAMREPTEERFSAQKIFFKANANDRGRTEVLQASLTGLGEVADEFAELREELHTMSPPPPFAQCLVMN